MMICVVHIHYSCCYSLFCFLNKVYLVLAGPDSFIQVRDMCTAPLPVKIFAIALTPSFQAASTCMNIVIGAVVTISSHLHGQVLTSHGRVHQLIAFIVRYISYTFSQSLCVRRGWPHLDKQLYGSDVSLLCKNVSKWSRNSDSNSYI